MGRFHVKETTEIGRHTFTEQEMVEFARRSIRSLSISTRSSEASVRLIASGWHTCAIAMRLMVQGYIGRAASAGSPGVENIRWRAPVRPGDTITYRRVILDSRVSQSKPGLGLLHTRTEASNQRGEIVMTMEGWGLFRRRPPAAP
jgi:acyl dehydratase